MSGAPVNQVDKISTITPASGPVGKQFNGGNPESWPGVDGNASDHGNFFPYNTNVEPRPVSTPNVMQSGGKKHRTRKRHVKKAKKANKSRHGRKSVSKIHKSTSKKQSGKRKYVGKRKSNVNKHTRRAARKIRGGSTRNYIAQPIRNAYRNVVFGAGELVNNWSGKSTPISSDPNPSNQPLDSVGSFERSNLDLNTLGSSADNTVANM